MLSLKRVVKEIVSVVVSEQSGRGGEDFCLCNRRFTIFQWLIIGFCLRHKSITCVALWKKTHVCLSSTWFATTYVKVVFFSVLRPEPWIRSMDQLGREEKVFVVSGAWRSTRSVTLFWGLVMSYVDLRMSQNITIFQFKD